MIHVSLDHTVHNGWSMDYQGLAPVDLYVAADPDAVAIALGKGVEAAQRRTGHLACPTIIRCDPTAAARSPSSIWPSRCARLWPAATSRCCICRCHGTAPGGRSGIRSTFIGSDGGGGIGGGPGISVGAALALKGSGRLPVSICGDGDFLMGVTALWTAVHYRIPLLLVIANNRSFYNDEVHQERVARMRNRPVENKWIGQRMTEPDIDLAALARAQGALGLGPITSHDELAPAYAQAIAAVEQGGVAVVDVRVEPGYAPAMRDTMLKTRD